MYRVLLVEHGEDRDDRTGTGTRSVFGYQTRYDLREGFPLMTTKKIFLIKILMNISKDF